LSRAEAGNGVHAVVIGLHRPVSATAALTATTTATALTAAQAAALAATLTALTATLSRGSRVRRAEAVRCHDIDDPSALRSNPSHRNGCFFDGNAQPDLANGSGDGSTLLLSSLRRGIADARLRDSRLTLRRCAATLR
jgi:hypothetical protein